MTPTPNPSAAANSSGRHSLCCRRLAALAPRRLSAQAAPPSAVAELPVVRRISQSVVSARYVLLKCVDREMTEKPSRVLQLSELQSVASQNSALRWGIDPRGPVPVTNSDGSIVQMQPKQGFSFVDSVASPSPFFICYEFYDGIAMHTERDERALAMAASFAQQLGAKFFLI